jgi:hypothetical protein
MEDEDVDTVAAAAAGAVAAAAVAVDAAADVEAWPLLLCSNGDSETTISLLLTVVLLAANCWCF